MAAAAWASPIEGSGCENKVEVEVAVLESTVGRVEEEQTTDEALPTSDQHPADGKSKPASEKIWGSFLKNSGLGKVMGGRKKKEQVAGGVDASEEGVEQEKPPVYVQSNQGEGPSPSCPNEQGSGQTPSTEEVGSQEQCIEKELDGEEATQEEKSSSLSKDVKPKQGEKSSVRDFIRKPVAKIFSHKSTEKKDSGTEAPKHGKTRSKSLDRLEDPEVCASALDQTDNSQVGGEQHKSAHHSAKHMKRWHSFKKMMAQKSQKKSTEDHKDVEGAEGPSSDTQLEPETLESSGKLDHSGQKRWKLKRSWTFQGLKRDPSVIGIHKPKGSDKDSIDNPKGEETPANDDQGAASSSEEPKLAGEGETQEKTSTEQEGVKGLATQRAKSVDHHANEIWTSFKKRVIPKSKRASDFGGGSGGAGEEDIAGEHEQVEEQTSRDHGKSSKTKRAHFNRAVSLKNFIMRKGKSTSVDLGEAPAGQREESAESTGDTSASAPVIEDIKELDSPANQAIVSEPEAPEAVQNGSDEKADAVCTNGQPSASTGQEPERGHPDVKEEAQAEPALEAACGETKAHGENGSSGADCDRKGCGMEVEDENPKDIIARDHEIIPQEDKSQEIVKQEDMNSQEAVHQTENACSSGSKDETSLNQEQCLEVKPCSGNPVAQSGECSTKNDCYDPLQTGGDIVILDPSFELEPVLNGPPQNGGAHPGTVETETEPNYQEESQKRMFYEAAASIVQTVVSAATEQLAKEKDLLDNGFKGSYHNNNDNFLDLDVNFCH